MRHNPASGAIVIMLKQLKMRGMAQVVGELTEQGSPASRPPFQFSRSSSRQKRQSVKSDRSRISSKPLAFQPIAISMDLISQATR